MKTIMAVFSSESTPIYSAHKRFIVSFDSWIQLVKYFNFLQSNCADYIIEELDFTLEYRTNREENLP